MPIQVLTTFVIFFGNSVIFGNYANLFPIIFQPFLFYPDWFFLDWPYQFILGALSSTHPYHIGFGPMAFGFGVIWYIIGGIIALNTKTGIVKEAMTLRHVPISPQWIDRVRAGSAIIQLLVLPLVIVNLLFSLIYHIVVIGLYWHLAIGEFLGACLSLGGKVGYELTNIIEKTVIVLMIAPALINIVIRTFGLFFIL